MKYLSQYDIEFIIERLNRGEPIPEDYKNKLFPIKNVEHELIYAGKMRREDILANEDGIFPVPLQIDKVYNDEDYNTQNDEWRNLLVFGDNLQFLKTIYENTDPLIKDRLKGKVDLIYIDPPFGTGDEYEGNKGQKGYSAKRKGTEFIEFLRRRLILANEILSPDGNIFVRIDYHFGDYIKVIMDEIFPYFKNDIVINRFKRQLRGLKRFNVATDRLLFYSKSELSFFNEIEMSRICSFCKQEREPEWRGMSSPGLRNPPERVICGEKVLPPKGRHWSYTQDKINDLEKEGRIRLNHDQAYIDLEGNRINFLPEYLQTENIPVDSNWTDLKGYVFASKYPTENPEELLERVILSATKDPSKAIKEGRDVPLVMDFFAGSGTTLAVAEKLGRRWVGCDIGKFSMYTMQKRLLNLQNSKNLENPKRKYKKKARSFVTVNTGLYDLEKVFELKKEDYRSFVMNLFEVEKVQKKIGGIKIDGQRKDGYFTLIYPYWQFKNASVNEEYLYDLYQYIGNKMGDRVYLIAPANYVDFITDYHEINNLRFYFLKVPYQIIKELHKVQFKKFRQPQSKKNVNDLEDAIGFHFIRQPEVTSKLTFDGSTVNIHINKFFSDHTEEETGKSLNNFESLAMIFIDYDYNGKEFVMDEFFFAEDLLPKRKKTSQAVDDIKEQLKEQKEITLKLKKTQCGKKIMIVYTDIYGNEFKEVLQIGR